MPWTPDESERKPPEWAEIERELTELARRNAILHQREAAALKAVRREMERLRELIRRMTTSRS